MTEIINGTQHNDSLTGGNDSDRLYGGNGGSDYLLGGEGADRYVLGGNGGANELDVFDLTEQVDARDVVVIRADTANHTNVYAEVVNFDEADRIRVVGASDYMLFTNRLGHTNLIIFDGELQHIVQFQDVSAEFVEERLIF